MAVLNREGGADGELAFALSRGLGRDRVRRVREAQARVHALVVCAQGEARQILHAFLVEPVVGNVAGSVDPDGPRFRSP